MRELAGIINLSESVDRLSELTDHRTLGAVPFGGRYRLIDFTLSNMVNSGIRNVGILVADAFGPLLDHIKSGKEWDLDRQRDGLFLLLPAYPPGPGVTVHSDIRNLYHNRAYLEKSRQEYVLYSGSNMVCNLDYRPAFDSHLKTGADITIIYNQTAGLEQFPPFNALALNEEGRVVDLAQNPPARRDYKVSLNMYILSKNLLRELVTYSAARNKTDLLMDVFMPALQDLKIYGWEYQGYVGAVNSLRSYYRHSMDLLSPKVIEDLFFQHGQIRTKIKNEAPAKYLAGSKVTNSLLASGCVVAGKVENSILFRGVEIGAGAVVRNSVVMQKSRVAQDAVLQNVILDKDVAISSGKKLMGDPQYPLVIRKLAQL